MVMMRIWSAVLQHWMLISSIMAATVTLVADHVIIAGWHVQARDAAILLLMACGLPWVRMCQWIHQYWMLEVVLSVLVAAGVLFRFGVEIMAAVVAAGAVALLAAVAGNWLWRKLFKVPVEGRILLGELVLVVPDGKAVVRDHASPTKKFTFFVDRHLVNRHLRGELSSRIDYLGQAFDHAALAFGQYCFIATPIAFVIPKSVKGAKAAALKAAKGPFYITESFASIGFGFAQIKDELPDTAPRMELMHTGMQHKITAVQIFAAFGYNATATHPRHHKPYCSQRELWALRWIKIRNRCMHHRVFMKDTDFQDMAVVLKLPPSTSYERLFRSYCHFLEQKVNALRALAN
eukprot:TRINITY_DN9441_c0_g1_i1.p1 TRINITY_DN9441_c0_g1~~TRINITY_DN9441_c0_g1_i1.p1  ORF type:complete len:348 (+),score=48.52 TRINITY_DN9441_c0_g1_i1:75-1118(+)